MIQIKEKVMVFGTFDIFHPGHHDFFRQAKKYGDYLIVVVARDKNVRKIKGIWPQNSEEMRAKNVRQSALVDKVVLGNIRERYKIIEKYKPAVICLGYDQKVDLIQLKKKLLEFDLKGVKIKRLVAYQPKKYKSSILKQKSYGKGTRIL